MRPHPATPKVAARTTVVQHHSQDTAGQSGQFCHHEDPFCPLYSRTLLPPATTLSLTCTAQVCNSVCHLRWAFVTRKMPWRFLQAVAVSMVCSS